VPRFQRLGGMAYTTALSWGNHDLPQMVHGYTVALCRVAMGEFYIYDDADRISKSMCPVGRARKNPGFVGRGFFWDMLLVHKKRQEPPVRSRLIRGRLRQHSHGRMGGDPTLQYQNDKQQWPASIKLNPIQNRGCDKRTEGCTGSRTVWLPVFQTGQSSIYPQ